MYDLKGFFVIHEDCGIAWQIQRYCAGENFKRLV